jgi:hypothetical protein
MIYRHKLIIFITLALVGSSAFGDEERFRVELLVLKHLDGFSDTTPQESLRDFSEALDLLLPPEDEDQDQDEGEDGDGAGTDSEPASTLDEQDGEAILEEEPILPAAVLVETLGDDMQQAWRRMRLSAGFRPEQYLSWEQSGEEPYPLIRVHDLELLYEEDPYADLRETEEDDQDEVPEFTDTNNEADSQDAEEAESEEEVLPPPTRFYRIDGTARFRKARFLHLDLDIEFRDPLFAPDNALNVTAESTPMPDDIQENGDQPPRPSAFRIHKVRQSRQVRTAEMQYFDGPVISVLAYITRVEILPDDTENPGVQN